MKHMRPTNAWAIGAIRSAVLGGALLAPPAQAGDIFGSSGLNGGSRWDAAPRTINGNERSLDGGLRYAMTGGSFLALRNQFQWVTLPSEAAFEQAVRDSFAAWESIDPATGLGTDLRFVADHSTPVVTSGTFGVLDTDGAEIDIIALDAGDSGTRGSTWFDAIGANATLTSGTTNYANSFSISGADIFLNSNAGAVYTLDFFRRLLTHEIGHALGLGDIENAHSSAQFIDDNYDGSTSQSAWETLTNSWADLVDVKNPANSPLSVYTVVDGDPGIDTFGVDILMESSGLGIGPSNPVTDLVPLRNDDYGTRQFLYPFVAGITGDLNADGFVGLEDLDILMANWGGTPPQWTGGDLDGNGVVDDGDLQLVIDNWGGGDPPAVNIPEPGTAGLLAALMLSITRQKR